MILRNLLLLLSVVSLGHGAALDFLNWNWKGAASSHRPPYSTDAYPSSSSRPYPTSGRPPYPTTNWPMSTTNRPYPTSDWSPYPTTGWPRSSTAQPYPPNGCPPDWIDSQEGCFLFHYTQATTWSEAQYMCETVGGYLAEPRTEAQKKLLTSLAFLEHSILGNEAWWIGLTDQSHEGRWVWAHSVTEATFSAWSPGSPHSGVNPLDCALMEYSREFLWSDTDCTHAVAAPICQRDQGGDLTTTPNPSTMDPWFTTTHRPWSTNTWPNPSSSPRPWSTTHWPWPSSSPNPYYVELRGGHSSYYEAYGNVHAVNINGRLGPVCDDDWDSHDARVVCRQLGYHGRAIAYTNSHWGSVSSYFAMDDVRCSGSESRLQDCSYSTSDDCGPDEGAGVYCYRDDFTTSGPTYPPWSTSKNN